MTTAAGASRHTAIDAVQLLDALLPARGILSGIPCSHLGGIFGAAAERSWRMVQPTCEGEAVAIACGVIAAGAHALVALQNSGLGSALDPLTSLAQPGRIAVPLVVSHRGHPQVERLPQHERMGAITPDLLALAGVPAVSLRDTPLERVAAFADDSTAEGRPFGVVVRKGDLVADAPGAPLDATRHTSNRRRPKRPPSGGAASRHRREALLTALLGARPADAVVVSTTGHTSRHLFHLGDDARNVYLTGSMGYASAFGLGLNLQHPDSTVVVLDGDASFLMHLGNVATIGAFGGTGFRQVVLDNGVHQSTGSQPTVSGLVDIPGLATSAGYRSTADVNAFASLDDAVAWLYAAPGPALLHARTIAESENNLPRVSVRLDEQLRRLAAWRGNAG